MVRVVLVLSAAALCGCGASTHPLDDDDDLGGPDGDADSDADVDADADASVGADAGLDGGPWCGGPGPGVIPDIQILGLRFRPEILEVVAGTTVRWTNDDVVTHTVTQGHPDDETHDWDSGLLETGQSFEHSFCDPGDYPYFCLAHPNIMRGLVRVLP